MKKIILFITAIIGIWGLSAMKYSSPTYSLTVKVDSLRNSKGKVQFTIYNKDETIPDEDFENYYRQGRSSITNKTATYTFKNLPVGKYAINILHDENENKKIDKGWILPVEGIGFSNFETIGFSNRPNFKKASFSLTKNTTKKVTIVYM